MACTPQHRPLPTPAVDPYPRRNPKSARVAQAVDLNALMEFEGFAEGF
jgi:hypothetical protein